MMWPVLPLVTKGVDTAGESSCDDVAGVSSCEKSDAR